MVGFDAKNKNILDPKYICGNCSLIIRNPVQLSACGHRQCQSCFDSQQEVIIKCPYCSTEMRKDQVMIDQGFKRDIQSLPIDCSLCEWNGILNNYQEHLDQTHSNPKCPYCDKQFHSVSDLNVHKTSECEKVTVFCPLKDFGCNEQIIRSKLQEHFLSKQHQDTIIKAVHQVRSQLPDTPMDTTSSRTTTTTAASASDPVTAAIHELYDTLNILTGGIEALNDDAQRLSNESLQSQIRLRAVTEDFSQVTLSVEESHSFLQAVKHNQDILSQDVASLKEKIDDMQYVSYDGTFVWKIRDVREKIMDAQSERQTSIYSPPFYSSPTGYKMRARLYLNGDGNARRTHMSLFFVLMRSMNDPILKFPFTYKVTFCLYDQTPVQRHIIDSFRPDIRSNSFQRPQSEMNIASGILKFFLLAMIEQEGNPYVQDDTMFIKIMVDFGNIPARLLPYALSLNPGLPTHTQQTMICREKERRDDQEFQQRAKLDELISNQQTNQH